MVLDNQKFLRRINFRIRCKKFSQSWNSNFLANVRYSNFKIFKHSGGVREVQTIQIP